MQTIPFIKMHGIGNDYLYIDGFKHQILQPERVAKAISDRHFGIGGDGMVIMHPSAVADCRMQMFNADGSEGRMCGNAIRCVGKLLYELNYCRNEVLTVETLSGIKTLYLTIGDNVVTSVRVAMGQADFQTAAIPMVSDSSTWINQPIEIEQQVFFSTALSMGNPHLVIFCDDIDDIPLTIWGKAFEHHSFFPERVNTEFVQIVNENTLRMRVWERGAGETLACGTGACAAVAAAVKNGYLKANRAIEVELLGGQLTISCDAMFNMTMSGSATLVGEGLYFFENR